MNKYKLNMLLYIYLRLYVKILFFLLKRTFLVLLRFLCDLRLHPLRLDPLRIRLRPDLLRLPPPCIAIALDDDIELSATPVIFFFRLSKDFEIVSITPIYILYFYFKTHF